MGLRTFRQFPRTAVLSALLASTLSVFEPGRHCRFSAITPTVSANCTGAQIVFRMGGDPWSADRQALTLSYSASKIAAPSALRSNVQTWVDPCPYESLGLPQRPLDADSLFEMAAPTGSTNQAGKSEQKG